MMGPIKTPRTAALVARHQAEIAALPMNPPREVVLEFVQRQCLELAVHAAQLEDELFEISP